MKDLFTRFTEKYKVCDDTGCWLWTGAINSGGYGSFKFNGKPVSAHKVAFILLKKEEIGDQWVLHNCDIRKCVNPDHLYLGDRLQNVKDMWDRKRNPDRRGEKHHLRKLTDKEIIEIRQKYIPRIITQQDLAIEYGVTQGMIGHIVNNKNWVHI